MLHPWVFGKAVPNWILTVSTTLLLSPSNVDWRSSTVSFPLTLELGVTSELIGTAYSGGEGERGTLLLSVTRLVQEFPDSKFQPGGRAIIFVK